MTLYADTVRLKIDAGNELEAFVLTRSDASKRPKCLLLHGNPRSLLDWEQVVPRLAEAADIAVVDLPGFGKSPRGGPGATFLSLDRLADYAISVATALDWREPFFSWATVTALVWLSWWLRAIRKGSQGSRS